MGISTQGGGLVNGAVNQGRGDGSTALSTLGGIVARPGHPSKEERPFDGAIHPGGLVARPGHPPKERGLFDGAFHQ